MRHAGWRIRLERALLFVALSAVVALGPTAAWALTVEQEAKLLPADAADDDYFGSSVALDGDTAVIGATLDDDSGFASGSAYVFTRAGTEWTEQAKLVASNGASADAFGCDAALDGDTALVGARGRGMLTGTAYAFTRVGSLWTEQAELLPTGGAPDDSHFGTSVAIDGDTAVIGAPHDRDNGDLSGSAYVFTRIGGVWTEQAKLLPADGAPENYFGLDVALDGDTAVIGAYGNDGNATASGAAYVFACVGGAWTQQAKLVASDGALADHFGWSVALDGDTAIIGAYEDDDNGEGSGSAYVFTRMAGVWTEQVKLLPADGAANDGFGRTVTLDGDTVVIASAWDDDNGESSGSAYVFVRAGDSWTEEAKVLPADGSAQEYFGEIAALDGDTVVFGVPKDLFQAGSAYVFRLIPDSVPATSVSGTLLLCLVMLGTGAYFVRR
jgi:hypothetical protein